MAPGQAKSGLFNRATGLFNRAAGSSTGQSGGSSTGQSGGCSTGQRAHQPGNSPHPPRISLSPPVKILFMTPTASEFPSVRSRTTGHADAYDTALWVLVMYCDV